MTGQIVPRLFQSRAKLAAGLGFGLLLPMLAVAGLIVFQARQTLRSQAHTQLQAATQLAAQVVEEHFAGQAAYVESFARRRDLAQALEDRDLALASAILEDLVGGSPALSRAFLTDPSGVEVADHPHVPQVIGQNFAHRDWYQGVTLGNGLYVSGVYQRSAEPPVHTVALATAVKDSRGGIVGYLVAQDTVESLSRSLAEVRPSPTGGIALLDRYGVLANRDTGMDGTPTALAASPTIQAARGTDSMVVEDANPLTGEPAFLGFTRIARDGWLVMAHDPVAAVLAPATSLQSAVLGWTCLCFLVVFAISFSAADALRRQHQELVELEATKSQVTSMLIHDLRSPLIAILGIFDLVRAQIPESMDRLRKDVDVGTKSSRRLLAMIGVLVDISRMEDGEMPFSRQPHELVELLRAKIDEYAAAAGTRRLTLRGLLPERSVVANVDRELIARVVDNLIANAIQHTPPGGEVTVELDDHALQDGAVTVRVRDTGEGIAENFLPRLFQKYARADGQTMGARYDSGLGLVFCRMAVELHGGTIEVESRVGVGSQFSIALPAS
ncbi:MAG: ATP-binding protein [Candidatus Binatia bacterium]